jgi:hypothetical protein
MYNKSRDTQNLPYMEAEQLNAIAGKLTDLGERHAALRRYL